MTEKRIDEVELRRAVLRGERYAWKRLYDDNFVFLQQWIGSRVRPTSRDDVMQETWLTAVRRIRDFDPAKGSFRGWLVGIASNIGAAESRRTSREPEALTTEPRTEAADAVPLGPTLQALPTGYREILLAKYRDHRAVADIASERGMTPKAVESMLSRARTAFRDAWNKTGESA